MSTIRVTWRKSAIGYARDQKDTIAALGLRRLNQTVEHADSPSIRGMVYKVRHLVSVDGLAADSPEGARLLAKRAPAQPAGAELPDTARQAPAAAAAAAE